MKKWIALLSVSVITLAAQSQSWLLKGNAAVSPDSNFIGTTDLQPLLFRINNYPAGFLDPRTTNTAFGLLSLSTNPRGNPPTHGGEVTANTAFGRSALASTTSGGWNTATGYGALGGNTSGGSNTATGMRALQGNSTGMGNTAMGSLALAYNTTGTGNTAIGSNTISGDRNASYYNTVLGYFSGSNYMLGWNNTLLGANCDVNTNDRYNCIAIGQGVTCTANSQARIGNSFTSSIGGYANWSNISDGRYKKNIQKNVKGLDFIMRLEPVTYHLDVSGLSKKLDEGRGKIVDEFTLRSIQEKEKILFSGFIAQDVEKAAKEVGYDFSGVDKPQDKDDLYGLRYAEFVVPLVKAIQEQQQMIEEIKTQNAVLQQRLADLERKTGTVPASNNNESLSIWPNPSKSELLVTINSTERSAGSIRVIDGKGNLLKQQQVSLSPGNNVISLSIKSFVSGSYFLTAEWNNGQTQKTAQVIKE
ncbi:MAG: tail fiber domain-containing protein [Chitinophagaceae bacterium]